MSTRAWLAAVSVAVLLGTVVLDTAAATHTYGHRYIVAGRLLDGDGNPVQQRSVRITLILGESVQAEIVTQTDCTGLFSSSQGTSTRKGEDLTETSSDGNTYFHYHDAELSSRIEIDISILGEVWVEEFSPATRYTFSRHSLMQAVNGTAACGGNDAFVSHFTVRVVSFAPGELRTGDNEIDPRNVTVTIPTPGGIVNGSGITDQNGIAAVSFADLNLTEGTSYEVRVGTTGLRSFKVTAEDIQYRISPATLPLPAPKSEPNTGALMFWGIVLGIGAVGLGSFVGYHKMRERAELRRALKSTSRKRGQRKS